MISQIPSWFTYTFLALLSLCVGSLLNVIILRLPKLLKNQWQNDCECLLDLPITPHENINLFLPRSFCPTCKTTIKSYYNIPLLSYLWLRGKCASCQHKISLRYPFIEALTMCLSLYAAWHFGITLTLIFALLFIWLLITLFFIDYDEQLLPDSLTLGLLWTGLIANTQQLFTSLNDAVFCAAVAYTSLWLLIQIYYLITGKRGMGHGDFKLLAALGAWFGSFILPFILLLASFCGAFFGIIYLKSQQKHRDTPIAFGPFLCLAGIVALFWGQTIIYWYLGFFR